MKIEEQTLFFTGGTSGIGMLAVTDLAAKGARIIVACRSEAKGEALRAYYEEKFPNGKGRIETVQCDLASFASIASACSEIKSKYDTLDVIFHNAGIMNFNRKTTVDGIEETLQVNLLAPVLISHLLVGLIDQSPAARLIFTSSGLHQGAIDFDDLEFEKRKFSSFKVYRQSKLGVILLCRLLAKQLADQNIGVYNVHPGVLRTDLGRDAGWFSRFVFRMMGKPPELGARKLVYMVETPKDKLVSGEYYADRVVTKITNESYDLDVASKLLETAKQYLSNYIAEPSLIFNANEKPV